MPLQIRELRQINLMYYKNGFTKQTLNTYASPERSEKKSEQTKRLLAEHTLLYVTRINRRLPPKGRRQN